MKFAPVLPPELYSKFDRGGYHMVQAHLIAHNIRVREWFKDRAQGGGTVILDNGVIELGEPDVASLLDVARNIHPTVIVCPDAFMDSDRTMSLFYSFAAPCQRRASTVMLVPHGRNVTEWLSCASAMLNAAPRFLRHNPWIGVPKVLDSFETNGRLNAIRRLSRLGHVPTMHLLGLWNGLLDVGREFLEYNIMGVDSTLAGAAALSGMAFGVELPKYEYTADDWSVTQDCLSGDTSCRLHHNIQTATEYFQKLAVPTAQIAHSATAS